MLSVLKRGVEPSVSTRALIANGVSFFLFYFYLFIGATEVVAFPFPLFCAFLPPPSPSPSPFFACHAGYKSRVSNRKYFLKTKPWSLYKFDSRFITTSIIEYFT